MTANTEAHHSSTSQPKNRQLDASRNQPTTGNLTPMGKSGRSAALPPRVERLLSVIAEIERQSRSPQKP